MFLRALIPDFDVLVAFVVEQKVVYHCKFLSILFQAIMKSEICLRIPKADSELIQQMKNRLLKRISDGILSKADCSVAMKFDMLDGMCAERSCGKEFASDMNR